MIPTEERAMSPLAAELTRLVSLSKGKRVLVEELFDGASRFDPGLVGDPAARSRFRNALDELRVAGRITLPAPQSRTGWDAHVLPPTPTWVMRVDPVSPAPRIKPAQRVWPSALEAAGRIATRIDEHELLVQIAAWMRDNPTPILVPVEERSLDLFDDEKAIDGYLKTRLFTSGALTLNLLACFIPPVPFVNQHVDGTGPTQLLVVENLATYTSFLTAFRQLDPHTRPDLHIGWGAGAAFTQSVLSIPVLDPALDAAYYFGDLDLAGLQIAMNAATQAERAGLRKLQPAESCYRFLLDGPRRWRRADGTNRHAMSDYDAVCGWLPNSLQAHAKDLLQARQRVPQERLGGHVLPHNPQLLTVRVHSCGRRPWAP
jgi:hypothetical protein